MSRDINAYLRQIDDDDINAYLRQFADDPNTPASLRVAALGYYVDRCADETTGVLRELVMLAMDGEPTPDDWGAAECFEALRKAITAAGQQAAELTEAREKLGRATAWAAARKVEQLTAPLKTAAKTREIIEAEAEPPTKATALLLARVLTGESLDILGAQFDAPRSRAGGDIMQRDDGYRLEITAAIEASFEPAPQPEIPTHPDQWVAYIQGVHESAPHFARREQALEWLADDIWSRWESSDEGPEDAESRTEDIVIERRRLVDQLASEQLSAATNQVLCDLHGEYAEEDENALAGAIQAVATSWARERGWGRTEVVESEQACLVVREDTWGVVTRSRLSFHDAWTRAAHRSDYKRQDWQAAQVVAEGFMHRTLDEWLELIARPEPVEVKS